MKGKKKLKPMPVDFTKMPKEVQWVKWLPIACPWGVGSNMYAKAQEIQKRYPEWFPWEAKYDSIPASVHEAFKREAHPELYKEWTPLLDKGIGLVAHIREVEEKNMKEWEENKIKNAGKPLLELFQELHDNEIEIRNREIAREQQYRKIWDKHYKQYGLELRK